MKVVLPLILSCFAIAGTSLPGAAWGQETQSEPPPREVPETVQTFGPNSAAIGRADEVNVYEAPELDPLREQLVAAMVAHHQGTSQILTLPPTTAVYLYLVDSEEAAFSGPSGEPMAFAFIAERGYDADPAFGALGCEAADGIFVRGWQFYISGSPRSFINIEPIDEEEHRVRDRICDGLGDSFSSLIDDAPRTTDGTVFDYLSLGGEYAVIILFPGNVAGRPHEHALVRYHWVSAVRSMYGNSFNVAEALQSPAAFTQMMALEAGSAASMPYDSPFDLWSVDPESPYPVEAEGDFAGYLQPIDSDWADFLAHSAVTIRGRQFSLLVDGEAPSIVPVFSSREIGSRDFWIANRDLVSLMQQISCVSGRFLVERGYAPVSATPHYARCPRGRQTFH